MLSIARVIKKPKGNGISPEGCKKQMQIWLCLATFFLHYAVVFWFFLLASWVCHPCYFCIFIFFLWHLSAHFSHYQHLLLKCLYINALLTSFSNAICSQICFCLASISFTFCTSFAKATALTIWACSLTTFLKSEILINGITDPV